LLKVVTRLDEVTRIGKGGTLAGAAVAGILLLVRVAELARGV